MLKGARKNSRGFTLIETLVVVAIVVILFALAMIPVSKMRRQIRQARLDSQAEMIFMAVQNRLTQLQAAGTAGLYQSGEDVIPMGWVPQDAEDRYTEETFSYVTSRNKDSEGSAAAAILPKDAVDPELWNGNWVVEFDPQSGSVYAVFFSPDSLDDYTPRGYDPLRYTAQRLSRGARVGYYGGDSVGAYVTGDLQPEIELENGEQLLLHIYCKMQGSSPLHFYVEIRDESGHSTGRLELTMASGEMVPELRAYRAAMVLDDLTAGAGRRFGQQARLSALNPGEDLTITVTVESESPQVDDAVAVCKTNSLYHSVSGSPEGGRTAVITCARHLQNLDRDSGVADRIVRAVQEQEIEFNSAAQNSWSACYPGQTFQPIRNSALREYESTLVVAGEAFHPVIYDLPVNAQGDAGLFESFDGGALRYVRLAGARIQGTGAVGALAGSVSGTVELEGCQVYLSAQKGHINTKTEDAPDPWLTGGETAGGLVGAVRSGALTVRGSFAATVVQGGSAAGGLVGRALDGAVNVERSYADCYVYSGDAGAAGGLVGRGSGTCSIAVRNAYAAGFLRAGITGGLAADELDGGDSLENVYTACASLSGDALTYSTAGRSAQAAPAVRNTYYLNSADYDLADTTPADYTRWSGEHRKDAAALLGADFTAEGDTYAYNLMDGLGLTVYSYPQLTGIDHYGDWKARFESGSLVYYEAYAGGRYGFRGANESTLTSGAAVLGDGYGMIYEAGAVPDRVLVTDADGAEYELTGAPIALTGPDGTPYELLPLPNALAAEQGAPAGFYRQVTSGGRSYYYNPHFASMVIAGDKMPDAPREVSVRTARQLYSLSLYYGAYDGILPAGAAFLQGRSIDYAAYDWARYGALGTAVRVQQPIGAGADAPFRLSYNGGGYPITGVSFRSTGSDGYAGMFGYNAGELRGIVLTSGEPKETAPTVEIEGVVQRRTVYVGALAGYNAGTVYNCAVSGYTMAEHAYSGATMYIGALAGYNAGSIRSTGVSCPGITATSTYAKLIAGGFVGGNSGQIRKCYAMSGIEILEIRGAETVLAGFAGENRGSVRESYCATALTSAGADTYGFAPEGGSTMSCYFLHNGTYSFAGQVHLYDYDAGAAGARGVTGEELAGLWLDGFGSADEAHTYHYPNTVIEQGKEAAYPYPACVTGPNGSIVHYGDWVTQANLGTLGVVYWEYEAGGANSGYHFSFLGFEKGETVSGSSLCTAHDDGGAVHRYGYGYYWESDQPPVTLAAKTENGTFQLGDRAQSVEKALEAQVPGFTFVAYETGDSGLRLESDRDANGTWTLTQRSAAGELTYSFLLCPFFADSYSYVSRDESENQEPGTDALPYQVRSVEQLQYINWSYYGGQGSTDRDVTDANYRTFPYLQYTYRASGASQTRAQAIAGDGTGGPRPIRTWKQSHDVSGTDLSAPGDGTKNKLIHPIAGGVFHNNQDKYSALLYNWFGGIYDGQSYYIKNIRISSHCYNVGLFGSTAGAEIRNIVLYSDNGSVIERDTDASSWTYQHNGTPDSVREYQCAYGLGGLAGIAYDYASERGTSLIYNCAIAGYVVRDSSRNTLALGEAAVGGLIGVSEVSLMNCSAVVDVEVNCTHLWQDGSLSSAKYGNFVRVGGLVGGLRYKAINCYTGGSITVSPDTLKERILYGDSTNTQFQTGTEGAVTVKWSTDRDAGGSNQSPATYVFIGGVGGSGFSANFINFTGGGGDTSDGQPVYENCYTYIDLPDMEGTIAGISIIGSVADRYGGQWTGARVTLTNCYYLSATRTGISFDKVAQYKNPNASKKSLADLLSTQAARSAMLLGDLRYLGDHLWDYRTDTNRYGQTIYNFNGLTELTYSQMADRVGADGLIHTENTGSPQSYPDFRTALGAGYAWVTIAEGDASIHGKYSFPGEDAALQGQDYPFPTVLTQRSSLGETVSLHYGAWPKEGLFWSKGIASLDMIADYDDAAKRSAIRLALTLEGGGALPDGEFPEFSYSPEGIVTAAAERTGPDSYAIILEGLETGAAEVTACVGGHTARLMVTVTAELSVTLEPDNVNIYVDDVETVELTARDKNGAVLDAVTWEILNTEPDVATLTAPDKAAGAERYTTTVKGVGEGEIAPRVAAACTLGSGRSYETVVTLPVTVRAQGVLGIANVSNAENPDYREGTMSRALDGWDEEPAAAQYEPGKAPVLHGSTLFLYGKGANASLGKFAVEAVTVIDSAGIAVNVLEQSGRYSVEVGAAKGSAAESYRAITVRGARAGETVTLHITLRDTQNPAGSYTLSVSYTLTDADTVVTAVYTDLAGRVAETRTGIPFGTAPGLPSAETIAAIEPPETGYHFRGLDTPEGWSPDVTAPLYADGVFAPIAVRDSITVTFSGIGITTTQAAIDPGENVPWPAQPTRAGYRFLGWTADNNQTRYHTGAVYVPEDDVEFRAVWRRGVNITVLDVAWGEATIAQWGNYLDYDADEVVLPISYTFYVYDDEVAVRIDGRDAAFTLTYTGRAGYYYYYNVTIGSDQFPAPEW